MLELLSTNRDLKHIVRKEEKTLSEVRMEELPSYEIGMERGMERGRAEAEVAALRRLLEKRFGMISPQIAALIDTARVDQIEVWFDIAATANGVDAVFDTRH